MKTNLTKTFAALAMCLHAFTGAAWAQQTDRELQALILRQDSLFWQAYNTCNVAAMGDFFAENVEMYHDKGGITSGLSGINTSFTNGICKPGGSFRLRREAVEGSTRVFPLKKNDAIYGAIFTGEHVFYVLENGKPERLDGLARFTHLWIKQPDGWKMTRVLSYDHGPAPYINKRKAVTLPAASLSKYAGSYKGPQSGILKMTAGEAGLIMHVRNKEFPLYAEKEGLFFSKERDLTFEFSGRALTIRESGNVVEELVQP
jgi:hypothetical protein